MSGEM